MDICLECGIPSIISGKYSWTSGGAIVQKGSNARYVVVDCNQVELIYDLFTFLDGPRAGVLICEARRKAMAAEILRAKGGLMGWLNNAYMTRRSFNRLRDLAIAYGYGDMRIRDYERGGRMVVELTSPYFVPFAEAELKAMWESLEGTQADLIHHQAGHQNLYTLECNESQEKQPMFKKVPFEVANVEEPPEGGEVEYRTCSTCGSPIESSRFSWNFATGTIYDSMREKHVCVISSSALNGVFQELEEHYGMKVAELVMRANKNYTHNLIRGNQMMKDLSGDEFLRSLCIRGEVGVIGLQEKPRITEVRIRNPWYVPIVAGEVAGWFEFKYGEDVRVSWTTDKEVTVVKIARAHSGGGRA